MTTRSPTSSSTAPARPPIPRDAARYADALIVSWGLGRRSQASVYATPSVVDSLFGHADPGGNYWHRISTEGAAGTIYVTYKDLKTGELLTVGVQNQSAQLGHQHAVYTDTFGS